MRYFIDPIETLDIRDFDEKGIVCYLVSAGENAGKEPLYSIRANSYNTFRKYVQKEKVDPVTKQPLIGAISKQLFPYDSKEITQFAEKPIEEQTQLQQAYATIFPNNVLTAKSFTASELKKYLNLDVQEMILHRHKTVLANYRDANPSRTVTSRFPISRPDEPLEPPDLSSYATFFRQQTQDRVGHRNGENASNLSHLMTEAQAMQQRSGRTGLTTRTSHTTVQAISHTAVSTKHLTASPIYLLER